MAKGSCRQGQKLCLKFRPVEVWWPDSKELRHAWRHCDRPLNLHSAQFDHPYAGAYCEVITDLSEEERKALFTMAAEGADDTASFLGPLLMELASFGDPDVGSSIARWTAFP